jgi:hypothetical protein
MPWCDPCGRFLNPTTLESDGSCPGCGTHLAEPQPAAKVPWHFWMMLVMLGLYLGWRAVQGIGWLVGQF